MQEAVCTISMNSEWEEGDTMENRPNEAHRLTAIGENSSQECKIRRIILVISKILFLHHSLRHLTNKNVQIRHPRTANMPC
ncbi:MAG: hypothetical protein D6732_26250 [Methanobacteriota archaeon]|nr:MAG: hypothetical protein D6732_26250 [Euryarchaeota archaeon]